MYILTQFALDIGPALWIDYFEFISYNSLKMLHDDRFIAVETNTIEMLSNTTKS